MKIDGQPLRHLGRETAWKLLGLLTLTTAKVTEVDAETFIQSTVGPECVELTPSCVFDRSAIAIHDCDSDAAITFQDETFDCLHIANHTLFELAISLSPLEFYFLDWNYPEVLYFGDRHAFAFVQAEGGNPHRWHGPVAPVGCTVTLDSGETLPVIAVATPPAA